MSYSRADRWGALIRSYLRMKKLLTLLAVAGLSLSVAQAKDTDIPVTELPKAVTDAITKAHPNSKLLSAEKDSKMDGTTQHYEVSIQDGDQKKELKIAEDGTIQSTKNDD